jgi:hypothetical protein
MTLLLMFFFRGVAFIKQMIIHSATFTFYSLALVV